jgi:hypothetical protein
MDVTYGLQSVSNHNSTEQSLSRGAQTNVQDIELPDAYNSMPEFESILFVLNIKPERFFRLKVVLPILP